MISRRSCCGDDSEDLANVIRVVAAIVCVLGYNLAMGDAYLCSPCLLRRQFCVGEDNDHAEVDVYLHYEPLQFFSKCCHSLDVGYECLPPIENFPSDVDKLPPDVLGLWSFRPLCDSCEELMDLVLVHRFEIAVIRSLQGGVRDVLSNNLGDPICNTFLDTEDVLSVVFVLGLAVCDFRFAGAVFGADEISGRSQCCKHVSLFDVDRQLLLVERVTDVARESLQPVG